MFFFYGTAQEECFLGIGGGNDTMIAEFFALNEAQKEKMANWSAELKIRNDILKNQAEYLLKLHEESPPKVLMEMSKEYRVLLDSMRQNVKILDAKLLSILNNRQYRLYEEICSELLLNPMYVNRPFNEK